MHYTVYNLSPSGDPHEIRSAVILGAGNVAWHLGRQLVNRGIKVLQVYNRTIQTGKDLAAELHSDYTSHLNELNRTADIYIISISDDAVRKVAGDAEIPEQGIVIHTAGSVGMDVFSERADNFGILYPFQTFIRDKHVDFARVPLLIEANNIVNLQRIRQLAGKLSDNVIEADSMSRMYLHMAAVLSSNFTNYLLVLSEKVLSEKKLPYGLLKALMQETLDKAFTMDPSKAQTGPAVRGNKKVVEKHLKLLEPYPEIRAIYKLFSEQILRSRPVT